MLPLLPKGSKYTGIDSGEALIAEARELFRSLPYESEFIEGDATEIELENKYDIAICQAFLLLGVRSKNDAREDDTFGEIRW